MLVPIVMRIDYRNYRQPVVIWTMLGVVVGRRSSRCCSAARSTAPRAGCCSGSLGVQPSELAKIAVIFFTAALLERRMDRIDEVGYSLLPIGVMVGLIVALILVEPDLGTAVTVLMIAAVMVFAAGLNYTLRRSALLLTAAAGRLPRDRDLRVPHEAGARRSSIRTAIRSATATR